MSKRFIAAAIAVILMCSLAGIGTMAWFTSSAVSNDNEFQTGTLILGSMIDGEEVKNTFKAVKFQDMEPGEPPVKVQTTKLRNVGSLPFYLYRITASQLVDINNANGEIDDTILDSMLMVRVKIGGDEVYYDRLSQMIGEDGSGLFDPIYSIQPDQEVDMEIEVFMDPKADNTYQGLSMQCDFTVYAKQNNAPISGQNGSNPNGLGATTLFKATGQNLLYNNEEWIKFDWDWIQNNVWASSSKDELRIRIKHETGNPSAEVYEIQVSSGNTVSTNGLIDNNDVMVGGTWANPHDEIWIKRSALPTEWDTMAVEIGGKLQSTELVTLPYQLWDLR